MDFGSGDGWVSMHEVSHEKKTQSQQVLGDKLPLPVTLASLAQNVESSEGGYLEVGDYHFRTLQTVGVIVEITNEDGNFKYLLHDPDDSENTFHVITIGDSENGRAKYVDENLEEDVRVRVLGKLKILDGEKTILAWLMQKMPDDKDFEIFKLEAEAAFLFHKEKIAEKMRNGNTEHWEGMLAPPLSRFSPRRMDQPAPLSPITPSHVKEEAATPSTSSTGITPRTSRFPGTPRAPFIPVTPASLPVTPAAPLIPSNPYIQNTANVQNNLNILINRNQNPTNPPPPMATPKTLNPLRFKVRACIRKEETQHQFDDTSGVPFRFIFERMGNVSEERIRAILEEMENDGDIYTAAHNEFRTFT